MYILFWILIKEVVKAVIFQDFSNMHVILNSTPFHKTTDTDKQLTLLVEAMQSICSRKVHPIIEHCSKAK